jgi:hypothetical protein
VRTKLLVERLIDLDREEARVLAHAREERPGHRPRARTELDDRVSPLGRRGVDHRVHEEALARDDAGRLVEVGDALLHEGEEGSGIGARRAGHRSAS